MDRDQFLSNEDELSNLVDGGNTIFWNKLSKRKKNTTTRHGSEKKKPQENIYNFCKNCLWELRPSRQDIIRIILVCFTQLNGKHLHFGIVFCWNFGNFAVFHWKVEKKKYNLVLPTVWKPEAMRRAALCTPLISLNAAKDTVPFRGIFSHLMTHTWLVTSPFKHASLACSVCYFGASNCC